MNKIVYMQGLCGSLKVKGQFLEKSSFLIRQPKVMKISDFECHLVHVVYVCLMINVVNTCDISKPVYKLLFTVTYLVMQTLVTKIVIFLFFF